MTIYKANRIGEGGSGMSFNLRLPVALRAKYWAYAYVGDDNQQVVYVGCRHCEQYPMIRGQRENVELAIELHELDNCQLAAVYTEGGLL